jgi:hypothetical protein
MDGAAVLEKYRAQLMGVPGVVGVGMGDKDGQPVIKVFVRHKVPQSSTQPQQGIPATLDGVEVEVIDTAGGFVPH